MPLVFVASALDVLDSFLKGGTEIRTHQVPGVIVLVLQILSGFSALSSLSNLPA